MYNAKFFRREAASWFVAAIIVLMFGYMLYAFAIVIRSNGIASSEAAGWIQAIGSVAAIFAAIWISSDQMRQQVAKEARARMENELAFLQSIQVEFEIAVVNTRADFGKCMRELNEGEPILSIYPVAESPFKIFDAQISNLSFVRDPALKTKIVRGYLNAMSLVQTIRMNNLLVEKYEPVSHQCSDGDVSTAISIQERSMRRGLVDYAEQLKIQYLAVDSEMNSLIAEISIHVTRI